MSNPFFTGGPVPADSLLGRQRDLNAAFDLTGQRGHLAIHGSSGMGKSSLLRAVAASGSWEARGKDPSQTVIMYVNCQELHPFTPLKLWRKIVEVAEQSCQSDAALQTETTSLLKETVAYSHVLELMRSIEKGNKRVLLLVDDYDAAVTTNASYTEAEMLTHLFEFRSLAMDIRLGRYSSMVATSRRLSDLGPRPAVLPAGSPWYNQYRFRPLKPFSKEEVGKLFDLMYPRFNVTPVVVDAITELAGYNPALLQYACSLLYEEWDAGTPINPDAFTRAFEGRTRQYYQNAWVFCSPEEQLCLMLIALFKLEGRLGRRTYDLGDLDALLSQRERELFDLAERGLIQKDHDTDSYGFCSSIMEWWVIKEIESSKDQAELDQREKILLGLSRKQVDQMKGVIKVVWEQKETIKSVAGYVGQLVGAIGKGVVTG